MKTDFCTHIIQSDSGKTKNNGSYSETFVYIIDEDNTWYHIGISHLFKTQNL